MFRAHGYTSGVYLMNWYQMTKRSAAWARRADAGIAVTMLRRRNEAHVVEIKPGGINSSNTLH
jgi:hypothetical protein